MRVTIGHKVGPYEILALLGAGGMGEVFRARDTRLSREVAIKLVHAQFSADAEQVRRFEQEARAASQLDHPNIVIVHDFGSHEGTPYIVSEFLEGEPLRAKLGTPMRPRRVAEYALQVAHGLAAAHEKGILHRDLKPENLFVTKDGRIKILDFGLAKLTQPASLTQSFTEALTAAPSTEPGVVMGTVGYMSPEQVQGKPADARTDLFSFGVILYEMLSGTAPFRRATSAETMVAILKDDPPELSATNQDVPPGLERIVRHCLEKEVSSRFQSALDVAFALEALTGTSSPSAPVTAMHLRRPSARLPALLTGAASIALIALVAGVLLGRRTARVEPPSFRRLTWRRGSVESARFGPDGQTVLYGAAWEGSPPAVFIKRPETPDAVALDLPSARLLAVAPTGELAIQLKGWDGVNPSLSRGTLARVAMTGGTPREVLESVGQVDWGPGGDLVIVHEASGKTRLEHPPGKALYETAGHVSFPRLSPRGDLIAFFDHPFPVDDLGSVAVVDLKGRKRTLSREFITAQGLAWSPSGDEVWFTAASAANSYGLWGVSLSGRERTIARVPGYFRLEDVARSGRVLLTRVDSRSAIRWLIPGQARERDLSLFNWSVLVDLSPDGKSIVFGEEGETTWPNYAACLSRSDTQPVRLGDGIAGPLSPDGKWVPSQLPRPGAPVVLLPTGPGEPKETSVGSLSGLSWLPDGKRLVFLRSEGEQRMPRLFVGNLAGEQPRPISPEGVTGRVSVSPDGSRVAVAGPDRRITLYSIEGGEPRPVASAKEGDVPLQWTPDGRALYVEEQRSRLSSPARVYRLDLDTGKRELWRELYPEDPAGVIVRAGSVRVTPDGSGYAYNYVRNLSDLYLVDGLR